ncbi:M18 family aminopeptidase [Cobetia marina]|jgi:aspartyl aminopeptidase|uniref:M18 family aminopeptidase n=1 Tax=Cobetia marina TaxID=28258 RepID=UPI002547C06C|nr:M18 family aminopeptidase [Cobetia pacifica]MDI6003796.1 M18 family aminopeptidase [Cobetia pacifica]
MTYAIADSRVPALLEFLNVSPTPWHATATMAARLEREGYRRLEETESWKLSPGERAFVTRNDSSLIAFQLPRGNTQLEAIRMIGAHTDSPCLRLKPNPAQLSQGWLTLGIETYGGVLLNTWFDRDLGLAGRVQVRHQDGRRESLLLTVMRPVACVPSLAIHLDRDVNNGRAINAQTQMSAVVMQLGEEAGTPAEAFHALLIELLEEQHGVRVAEVIDFELGLHDLQPAAQAGLKGELVASARLDNLLSCFVGLEALLGADGSQGALFVATDHEEVGSASACGAQGPFLADVLKRINHYVGLDNEEGYQCLVQRSLMISCDNAHAVHPNFPDKHDAGHGPKLNAGPVIKVNANQRYATNSTTAGLFRELCLEQEVPVQTFVSRADMGCGSTIGPITASEVGVPTLDVGLPQWGMHSIRETSGSADVAMLIKVLVAFCNRERLD